MERRKEQPGTDEPATNVDGGASAPDRPSTRDVAAGATLASVGAIGVFLPFAAVAFIGQMLGGVGALGAIAAALINVPVVSVVAIVAAVATYRRAPWVRPLSAIVGLFLLASLPIAVAVTAALPTGEGGPGGVLLWHAFLVMPNQFVVAAPATVAGAFVLWALRSAATPPERTVAQRPRLAMLILVLIGIESVAPYLSWLATNLLPSPVAANGGPVHGEGLQAGIGLALAIPSLLASIAALGAARAIRLRAPYGPYFAPAAAAVAGPWSAFSIVVVGSGTLVSADEGSIAAPVALAAQALVTGLIAISALAFFVVTASVLRRRDWFFDPPPEAARRGRPALTRPGRFWTASAGIAAATLVPVVAATAISIVNPPPPQLLFFQDVLLDGVPYHHAAPLDVEESDLSLVGSLSAWTEDLEIDVARPEAFALPGVPAAEAIAIRGGPDSTSWPFALFYATDLGAGVVPETACRFIPLEDPAVLVRPCLPLSVTLGGAGYEVVSGSGYVVGHADLASLATTVEANPAPDSRVDRVAYEINGVPSSEAIALRVGERILLYVVSGRFIGGELCRYSPIAVQDPLLLFSKPEGDDKYANDQYDNYPDGCGFPTVVVLEGRVYLLEIGEPQMRIPTTALVPVGTAAALHPDYAEAVPGASLPFPPTIDPTAYQIAGVDRTIAIAFLVGDRTAVAVVRDKEHWARIAPGLCAYVSSADQARWEEEHAEPLGCPAA